MADINGPCKPQELHLRWTDRITAEFYEQVVLFVVVVVQCVYHRCFEVKLLSSASPVKLLHF